MTSTKVFSALNGQRLVASADDGERSMLDVVAQNHELTEVEAWLEAHCTPRDLTDRAPA